MTTRDFQEIWLVYFTADRAPGEGPVPLALAAKEYHSGRPMDLGQEVQQAALPFSLGPDVLVVVYDASVALGCFQAVGWPMPARVFDLHAEFRCLHAGLLEAGDYPLPKALAYLRRKGRDLDGLDELFQALLPQLDLEPALQRGRYGAAVARMQARGTPLDVPAFLRIKEDWAQLKRNLVHTIDAEFGVYDDIRLDADRFENWLAKRGINWPRKPGGKLDLTLECFRDQAVAYPQLQPLKELRATLSQLKLFDLEMGADGRNRTSLRPFAAKTGRNQPSNSRFVFGPATWVRFLIRPAPGMALAYLDWSGQEYGIAAALSGDALMLQDYQTGDPYLAFGKRIKMVPEHATKTSHPVERERLKTCCGLGAMYGACAKTLARKMGVSEEAAQEWLRQHKHTYRRYWQWLKAVVAEGRATGLMKTACGWQLHVDKGSRQNPLRNFLMQATGADLMRRAACLATERGLGVCCPVHDAFLLEAPLDALDAEVERCREAMTEASAALLGGFQLRVGVQVVCYPERFRDPRGEAMWAQVCNLSGLDDGTPVPEGTVHTPAVVAEDLGQERAAVAGEEAPRHHWMTGKRRSSAASEGRLKKQGRRSMQLLTPSPVIAGPLPADWFARLATLKRRGVQTGLLAVAAWWAYVRSGYQDAFTLSPDVLGVCAIDPEGQAQALADLHRAGLLASEGPLRIHEPTWRVVAAAELTPGSTAAARRLVVDGAFAAGPVPVSWLAQLAHAPKPTARSVLLALAVWRLYVMHDYYEEGVVLTHHAAELFGLDRYARDRALEVLEATGLVRVQRRCDQNPLVTVLRGAVEWYVFPANAFGEAA